MTELLSCCPTSLTPRRALRAGASRDTAQLRTVPPSLFYNDFFTPSPSLVENNSVNTTRPMYEWFHVDMSECVRVSKHVFVQV